MSNVANHINEILDIVTHRNECEPEFLQAVRQVFESLVPILEQKPAYVEERIIERMAEPERQIMFRVPWVDDNGTVQINRGFLVQFNSAIGPCKGGLRFHPSVSLGILKFLGFDQVYKNSLTSLPMGGGMGGSDFDPRGKSDPEVMRFCQSFMTELECHIEDSCNVSVGDIGVGTREIGFLSGQYKRLRDEFTGVPTGKRMSWGGSLIHPEATGYGAVYFAQEMLAITDDSLEGKRCVISGSGNVAQFTAEKLLQLGAIPLTFSDSDGTIYDPNGIDKEKLEIVKYIKNVRRGRIREYADKFGAEFKAGSTPWSVPCECAFPSATQYELDGDDAKALIANGCKLISEGANMPSTPDAVDCFLEAKIFYGPGKAANAGGVAISDLELSQNWGREEVDGCLQQIMMNIHRNCRSTAEAFGLPGNYVVGANIAGFTKVADSMLEQGLV